MKAIEQYFHAVLFIMLYELLIPNISPRVIYIRSKHLCGLIIIGKDFASKYFYFHTIL